MKEKNNFNLNINISNISFFSNINLFNGSNIGIKTVLIIIIVLVLSCCNPAISKKSCLVVKNFILLLKTLND